MPKKIPPHVLRRPPPQEYSHQELSRTIKVKTSRPPPRLLRASSGLLLSVPKADVLTCHTSTSRKKKYIHVIIHHLKSSNISNGTPRARQGRRVARSQLRVVASPSHTSTGRPAAMGFLITAALAEAASSELLLRGAGGAAFLLYDAQTWAWWQHVEAGAVRTATKSRKASAPAPRPRRR